MIEKNISTIQNQKAYLQIVNQIINLVIDGKVCYEEKFYTEQELVNMLGVSRPTLREALRVLEFLGVTQTRPHNGIYIRKPVMQDGYLPLLYTIAFDKLTNRELFGVRQALQLEMAAEAARLSTAEEITQLRLTVEEMERLEDPSVEEIAALDYKFHAMIVDMGKNRLAQRLMSTIEPLLQAQMMEHQRGVHSAVRLKGTLRGHWEILHWIERGDSEAARSAMYEHLAATREEVLNNNKVVPFRL